MSTNPLGNHLLPPGAVGYPSSLLTDFLSYSTGHTSDTSTPLFLSLSRPHFSSYPVPPTSSSSSLHPSLGCPQPLNHSSAPHFVLPPFPPIPDLLTFLPMMNSGHGICWGQDGGAPRHCYPTHHGPWACGTMKGLIETVSPQANCQAQLIWNSDWQLHIDSLFPIDAAPREWESEHWSGLASNKSLRNELFH